MSSFCTVFWIQQEDVEEAIKLTYFTGLLERITSGMLPIVPQAQEDAS